MLARSAIVISTATKGEKGAHQLHDILNAPIVRRNFSISKEGNSWKIRSVSDFSHTEALTSLDLSQQTYTMCRQNDRNGTLRSNKLYSCWRVKSFIPEPVLRAARVKRP